MLKKGTQFILITLIIVTGLYAYSNSLSGEFIWDDNSLIKNNAYIKDYSHISKIFTKDIFAGTGDESNFYRPLQTFTYIVDYSLWKLNVEGYHLTNILLHILVALGIYWLVNILWGDRLLSFFTSLLFVVHPLHTEVVTYISGRADSLAAIFILLSFILYIKGQHSKSIGIYILTLLSYILALFSKEHSLVLPALLLLYHYAFKRKLKLKSFLPLLSIAFIYILLRLTLLSFPAAYPISPPSVFLQRLPGFFVALTNYIRLLFLPFNLHMEYGSRLFDFTNPKAIVGIFILIALFIYAVRIKKSNKLVFFSISWFFITLIPVSNLYPVNAYMAEHWLYFPSIGFFLVLAKGISCIYRDRKFRILAIIFLISLSVFYSYLTLRQNEYWREPITFYKRALRYTPGSWRIHHNLGSAYADIGNYDQAIASYKKALRYAPGSWQIYHNLGNAYGDIGNYGQAIVLYEKSIEINPKHARVYNNLGVVYSKIGDHDQAIVLYRKAAEIIPEDAGVHNNLAMAYYHKKEYDLAIKHCDMAIEFGHKVNPGFLKLLEACRK